MREMDDWELVARVQNGDKSAFADLVRRYQGPVMHFLQHMVHSPQDAEDLAQECFVRLYRHLERLQPRAKFSTVLFGIGRNLALNFLRDNRRRGAELTDSMETQAVEAHTSDTPERRARIQEIESALRQGIAQLTREHREILLLREVHGLDYDSIAQVVHCRKGTVRSRLARAREQLRARLEEAGGEWL